MIQSQIVWRRCGDLLLPYAVASCLAPGQHGSVSLQTARDLPASAIQRMIDECLIHASELRKHPQDARFGSVWPRTLWVRASGGVSAGQLCFSVKILTNRGQ